MCKRSFVAIFYSIDRNDCIIELMYFGCFIDEYGFNQKKKKKKCFAEDARVQVGIATEFVID